MYRTAIRSARRYILSAFVVMMVALISGPALAATKGATVSSVNLRAGPGTGYPVVISMPPSADLTIYGCLSAASWCDVSWRGARGWVSSNYVNIYYQGQTVTLSPALIPMIGLSGVTFNQAYWNNHYASQPWYGQWNSYYARPGAGAVARSGCVGAACGGSGAVRGPYGGGAAARGGCVGAACGGAGVVRGPYGGGAAARGACGPERCAGGAIMRRPGGGIEFRRGVIER